MYTDNVCLANVTVDSFKDYFDRHFPFAKEDDSKNKEFIRDIDIENAFDQAGVNFNCSLWRNKDEAKLAFFFLSAHYLCMDMQMAQSGLNSIGKFILTSKSVGDVSASYGVPQAFINNPIFNYLTTTEFGMKYLSLVYPKTIGRMAIVEGATLQT